MAFTLSWNQPKFRLGFRQIGSFRCRAVQFDPNQKPISECVEHHFNDRWIITPMIFSIRQWFLTFLEVLNPTSSKHAFIKPFVVAKNKIYVMNFIHFIFIAQNLLLPNLWNWLTEPLGFDQTQVKNHWYKLYYVLYSQVIKYIVIFTRTLHFNVLRI